MTLGELLTQNGIKFTKVLSQSGLALLKIENTNVLFWNNENNVFKMKREIFEALERNCSSYRLVLLDKEEKKYYYLKFPNMNNWLSNGFNSCDKKELYLGKQVLNCQSTLNSIVMDLKKCK